MDGNHFLPCFFLSAAACLIDKPFYGIYDIVFIILLAVVISQIIVQSAYPEFFGSSSALASLTVSTSSSASAVYLAVSVICMTMMVPLRTSPFSS